MLNILLLEDNERDARLIISWVKEIANIAWARNGEQFKALLKEQKFDIILSDYKLTTFSAIDVLRIVHGDYPQLPVIIVSGTIDDATGAELLKFHASDYILKDRPHRIIYSIQRAYNERKEQAQKLRNQRIENIGSLTMGIIHDLNNVLSPVLTVLGMIEKDLPEKNQWMVNTAQKSVLRGAEMLKQVLIFIRGMDGQFSVLDVKAVLRQILMFVREVFPRSITLVEKVDPDLPGVLGNATQIHQVMLNFCINAQHAIIKASKPVSELTLAANVVELKNFQPFTSDELISGRYLSLEVRDTGTGMPRDVMNQIFEPYFTTKSLEEGTGLGLSTCLIIAKNHHGYIDVISQEGVGSMFRLLLPVSDDQKKIELEPIMETPSGRGETILLAEDEKTIQEVYRLMLESYNYRVLPASNGAEALGLFLEPGTKVDLVLTDIIMPVMDGPKLIAKLREKNPAIKIVCMTGTDSRIEDLVQLQTNGSVNKPCSTSQLLTVIRKVLDESS